MPKIVHGARPAPPILRERAEAAGLDPIAWLTDLLARTTSEEHAALVADVSRPTIARWKRWGDLKVVRR